MESVHHAKQDANWDHGIRGGTGGGVCDRGCGVCLHRERQQICMRVIIGS